MPFKKTGLTVLDLDCLTDAFGIVEFGWMPQESRHAFDFEPTDPAAVRQSPNVEVHEKYAGYAKFAAGFWGYSRKRDDIVALDEAGAQQEGVHHHLRPVLSRGDEILRRSETQAAGNLDHPGYVRSLLLPS